MRRMLVVLGAAFALGANCDPPPPEPKHDDAGVATIEAHFPPGERAAAIADGKATIVRHQCTRCHTIDDIAPGPRPLHCTSCHEFLKGLKPADRQYKEISSKYGESIIQRYQRNIWHLRRVPDLTEAGKRLRPDWIASFLAEPYDVRPVLSESMIRHKLAPDDIQKVTRYFAAVADVAMDPPRKPESHPSEATIAAGRTLLLDKGCGKCHTYGNVPLGSSRADLESSYGTALLAPNLRFAAQRMRPLDIGKWIQNPQAFQKTATMPAQQVSDEETKKIVAFLQFGDAALGPIPDLTLPAVAPSPTPVTWEDVKERVIGRICVHCHMNDYEKDKGPGNKGGFGYSGMGMAIRTYESLVWGAEKNGVRYSILEPQNGEPYPPIVMAMLRRRVEAARDQVVAYDDHERPEYPKGWQAGMPLGLPAMSDEEIGIVERWILDGCPGPTKVSGMAGIYDGFLVPDGPIAKNKGCELRPPSKARPAWTTLTEKKGAEAALEPLK